jgi:RecB family exonuclease
MPELSARLADFLVTAIRYGATGGDAEAERLLSSPFAGLARPDARALAVTARRRGRFVDALGADLIPLGAEGRRALARLTAGLTRIAAEVRAQGSSARGLLSVIELAFDLESAAGESERATLGAARTAALSLDAATAASESQAWTPEALALAIEALFAPNAEAAAAEADAAQLRAEPALALQPLRVYLPEQPAPVARRRGHYSASSLGMYAECERKWYYRYVCAAVEDPGSSASFYGTAFHFALEHFHQAYPRADAAPVQTLENALDGWINTAFDRYRIGFATNVEFELQRRRARRTAKRYLAWFIERSRAHPFTVIGTEAQAELTLEGYHFIGYIDRLDRDDATGGVSVIDYKTGAIATSAAEYRAAVAEFVDFQLPFYYWARTAAGDRVTRLALVPLKDALLEVVPVELEVVLTARPQRGRNESAAGTIGIDELERARARMIELARKLADEPILHFAVARDCEACTYCAYRNGCRERPLAHEERFGR